MKKEIGKSYCWRQMLLALAFLHLNYAQAQETKPSTPAKGSYLYYGQPALEDNSFLLEEAFNQPRGVIQNVATFHWNRVLGHDNYFYSFTQELPITEKHQFSYTLNYYSTQSALQSGQRISGFGDIFLSYQTELLGKKDWAMVIPRFTAILPTGNSQYGHGYGGYGGQVNFAATKRLSQNLMTHYNGGMTFIKSADFASALALNSEVFEQDLFEKNVGTSLVWYPVRKFNLLLEYQVFFSKRNSESGLVPFTNSVINPGFRFAIDYHRAQLVPGLGIPIRFENGKYISTGLFFYLSLEPDFTKM